MTEPTPETPRTIEMRPNEIVEYGCVKCQGYHHEGDALYEAHLMWQSKHGIQRRPATDNERVWEPKR